MQNTIELTKENLIDIKYKNIIAVTIAEGGAMGEPNGFYAVESDYKLYHLNFGSETINKKELFDKFPLLKTFKCFCEHVYNLEDGWEWFNMGFGNYLIVRDTFSKKVNEYISNNLKENWQHGELYQKWYEVIINVCK